jgi:hypothetical protein
MAITNDSMYTDIISSLVRSFQVPFRARIDSEQGDVRLIKSVYNHIGYDEILMSERWLFFAKVNIDYC